MINRALTELKQTPDGAFQFRLLSISLPQIEIENVHVHIKDVIEAITENRNGGISELPIANVTFQVEKETLEKQVSPPDVLQLGGWTLKFLYAFDGELPPLPKQYAVYFLLSRIPKKEEK